MRSAISKSAEKDSSKSSVLTWLADSYEEERRVGSLGLQWVVDDFAKFTFHCGLHLRANSL